MSDNLMKQVIEVVFAASNIMNETFTVADKGDPANLVTSADVAVQNYLQEHLCLLLPGSVFFGEENGAAANGEYVWIVDPIDGTTNFARGIAECCISVALVHAGSAELAVVYAPRQSKLYSAQAGKGAFCNGKRIHTSNMLFESAVFCTALSLYRKEYAKKCMDIIAEVYPNISDIRRFGTCALEMCYLAEGICDLFFEFRVYPWDCAAASLVLQEAGGCVSGHDGRPIRFDRTTPVIAANNAENFEKLLRVVIKHIPELPYEEVLV